MVNTAEATKIRQTFSDIIDEWGSNITIVPPLSKSRNDQGVATVTYGTPTDTVGVLDANFVAKMRLQSVGRLKENETQLILKGTEVIDETYKVISDGVEYNVMSLVNTKAANVTIVWQLIIGGRKSGN